MPPECGGHNLLPDLHPLMPAYWLPPQTSLGKKGREAQTMKRTQENIAPSGTCVSKGMCSFEHMPQELTERQKTILDFICRYQRKESVPPSSRIIQSRFKLKSQTSVMRDLAVLAEIELIKQTADGRWGSFVCEDNIHIFKVPVLGEIPAGMPAVRDQTGGERITIDLRTFGIKNPRPDRYFALRVIGDSMIDANIVSGDYAICEWCEPRVGDVIAALVDETSVIREAARSRVGPL